MIALIAALLLSCSAPAEPAAQTVGVDELLALRDLSGLSVSPDGAYAAFQVQQADLERNGYRSTWCLTDLARGETRALGDGGDMAMPRLAGSNRRTGMWMTLAPRWSPDGRRIAVLARRDEQTQIEVCTLRRQTCRRVTRSAGDIEDFVWSADGAGFIFHAGPARLAMAASLAREGDQGFRVDERFDLFHAFTPIRQSELERPPLLYADARTGRERPAHADEIQRFQSERRAPISMSMGTGRSQTVLSAAARARPSWLSARDVRDFIVLGTDSAAWTEPADPDLSGASPPLSLAYSPDGGRTIMRCSQEQCVGRIVEIAATPDQAHLLFIRREGWGESQHGLYLWDMARGAVTPVLVSDAAVRVCTPRATDAICLYEGPTRPRILVAIDYATGSVRTLFDPNPQLLPSAFIEARKLQWTTPLGHNVFGYVLAPLHAGDGPWPLIVVQYRAAGFLRGGVGDEYPIQAFARRGFAVLVLERPDPFNLRARVRDPGEIDRQEWADLSERRRTMAALTSGIDLLVDLGIADRGRIGVTGLSDGAETAVFALIHCNCIAAAAISGGVHDPLSRYFTSDAARSEMDRSGRGAEGGGEGALWPLLSPALNVDRIGAPILAQVADRELAFILEMRAAFVDRRRPFDLYVFPDEYHVKRHPRHRRAVYRRSLQWFAFWLLREEDNDPLEPQQYARWRAWRAAGTPPP